MKITPFVSSRFRSDGGAMFGLVPKPIWSKLIPPNDNNGIPQNANSVLVELDDGRKGLIDTGCGDPAWYPEKYRAIQSMDNAWLLPDALQALNTSLDDIEFVLLSHLHWDHVGGIGRLAEDGTANLAFPNAQIFVHTAEWQDATSGDPLLGNSYPDGAIDALKAVHTTNLLLVTDQAPDILPGIRMARSSGHTYGHCAIVLTGEPVVVQHPNASALGTVTSAVYAGDNCPTSAHLRLVFQTAYDTFPLDTRQWKQECFPQVVDDHFLLLFSHDPTTFGGTLARDPKREYTLDDSLPVSP